MIPWQCKTCGSVKLGWARIRIPTLGHGSHLRDRRRTGNRSRVPQQSCDDWGGAARASHCASPPAPLIESTGHVLRWIS
eukprot:1869678-Rhodomonas_salina.1